MGGRGDRSAVSQMTYRQKKGRISHSFLQTENLEGIEWNDQAIEIKQMKAGTVCTANNQMVPFRAVSYYGGQNHIYIRKRIRKNNMEHWWLLETLTLKYCLAEMESVQGKDHTTHTLLLILSP